MSHLLARKSKSQKILLEYFDVHCHCLKVSKQLSQMPNRKALRKQKQATSADRPSNIDRLQEQVQKLIQKKSFRQAIEKIKQISKMHPEAEIRPSEAEIWALQGQQEYHQGHHRQAQDSLRQAIELGTTEESYYWLARSLMVSNDSATALETMRGAFDSQILTQDYAGCYLKLLLLEEATAQVADLLKTQPKRFSKAQLHWAQGFLALKAGKLPEALEHFKKMGGNATPGDSPAAWIVYVQQQLGDWSQAEDSLNLPKSIDRGRLLSSLLPTHPAISRLSLIQAAAPKASPAAIKLLDRQEGKLRILSAVIRFLQLIDQSNHHDAAHILQKLPRPCIDFPEVDSLYRSVMILAADKAMENLEVDCIVPFLEAVVYEPPFDVQLVLKLRCMYEGEEYPLQHFKRLYSYFLTQVQQLAQDQPQNWPVPRLNSALAQIHCWLADVCISRGSIQHGYNALQTAIDLCPESPEVIGRQGLKAYLQGDKTKAIALLTKSLENGCKSREVYDRLLMQLEEQGDRDAVKDIQRRFGQALGDEEAEDLDQEEIPEWIEAFSTQKYPIFESYIAEPDEENAAIEACRIFVAAVEGEPNSAGKVGFKQEWAVRQWQELLQKLADPEKILAIQAIFLAIQLFTKRQKGVAALQNDYLQQLFSIDHHETPATHLMLWAVKGDRLPALQIACRSYLRLSPQPWLALSQLQFRVRRFATSESLRSLIDELLRQDAQNPQLLLAKATTYDSESNNYHELKEQGFELARRLQDANALQSYRAEERFQSDQVSVMLFTGARTDKDFDQVNFLKQIVRKMFGDNVPPEKLAEIMPKLLQMLEENMYEDDDDFYEDDDDDDFSIPQMLFGGKRPSPKNKKGRR
jgi:tetratricopeptide (TPR) repeat protein